MSLHIETYDSENVDDTKKKANVSSQNDIKTKVPRAIHKARTREKATVIDITKKAKVSSQEGVTIKPFGATPKTRTREKSNCGTDAV